LTQRRTSVRANRSVELSAVKIAPCHCAENRIHRTTRAFPPTLAGMRRCFQQLRLTPASPTGRIHGHLRHT